MKNGFDFNKIPLGSVHPSHRRFHGSLSGVSLIGGIIGTAISTAINETVESYAETTERARTEEQERARIRSEYNRKMANLPANCPNCGAPTCGKMYCEYCESKLV